MSEEKLTLLERILFHSEVENFQLAEPTILRDWIQQIITDEEAQLTQLNYIFCDDDYLHQINVEYLQHDTLTDIITFPYEAPPNIEGDIYISIDRVRENADTFQVTFEAELHRVIIHGVLHLCGQGDKTEVEQQQMRAKEDAALTKLEAISKKD